LGSDAEVTTPAAMPRLAGITVPTMVICGPRSSSSAALSSVEREEVALQLAREAAIVAAARSR
jgi:hypothetical protein